MSIQIIIRNKDNRQRLGKTRSEVEENLVKEGRSTMDGEQLDKLKYAEKWFNENEGGKPMVLRPPDKDMDMHEARREIEKRRKPT